MCISLIVAVSANNVIGVRGELPWHLPDDLKRFKKITMGKPIVMGRLTWASIGRPLPGRQNIVISRNASLAAPGCDVVGSPNEAIEAAGDAEEIMIIGGGQLYREFLPRAGRIYLTRVAVSLAGDTYFPALADDEWTAASRESHPADEAHNYSYENICLDRIATRQVWIR